ncbi:MAG TPA: glutathione S-transferase family protein [Thermoleophilaceae bacterium]|nr:glutathione S-transferase family protein [Thermoleophilaceae bacterium]
MSLGRPLLWHLPISHFSEKVRWAFDWKRVPHRRRVMPPGLHPFGGLLLTGGRSFTMPVLVHDDGRRVDDSTAIIEWLEETSPSRSLYPADPAERARALALEEWFDENVGPHARRWAFNALLTEPEALRAFAVKQTEWAPFAVPTDLFAPLAKLFLNVRYSTEDEAGVEEARGKLAGGLDRLEAELDGGSREFLVGNRFTVADLTAAALFYPLVLPPQGPWEPVRTAAFDEFQSSVRDRPGFRWVEETFRRWR